MVTFFYLVRAQQREDGAFEYALISEDHPLYFKWVFHLAEGKTRRHTGKCCDCSGPLELFEVDMQKSTKIMACHNCGLFHYYKKDFFGNYKLLKATKIPEGGSGSAQSPNR